MIKGIGADIVEVKRFRALPYEQNKSFYRLVFTPAEIRYCLGKADPAQHFAARFAGKEAVVKALNKSVYQAKQIEIVNGRNGAPVVKIKNKETRMLISLSHTKDYALAFALWLN